MIDKANKKLKYLCRYTSITALFCILESKELHLSNPENWKDRTDAAFLKKYAENEKKKIRVLCFFDRYDRNNYWELYAKYGCMIEFRKEILFNKIQDSEDFEFKEVEHIKQRNFSFEKHKEKLPFIKQWKYKNEKEYRLVWKGSDERKAVIPIAFESIVKIVISGDIDEKFIEHLKEIICKITNGAIDKVKITHSKIYENEEWIKEINRVSTRTKQRKPHPSPSFSFP